MHTITIPTGGRFGNNIFQYIACKILSHKYNLTYVPFSDESYKPDIVILEDSNFIEHLLKTVSKENIYDWNYLNLNIDSETLKGPSKKLLLHGYFQNLNFANKFINEIKEIVFNKNNNDFFNKEFKISDILTDSIEHIPSDEDIILHVRLDDFFNSGKGSNVLSPSYYIDALNIIKKNSSTNFVFNKAWIICDNLKNIQEIKYIEKLKQLLVNAGFNNVIIHSKSLIQDWNMCRLAKRFISSNSTFAWTALIAGNALCAVIPDTSYYDNQTIVPLEHIPMCYVLNATTIHNYEL